jgi:hypothetical protein
LRLVADDEERCKKEELIAKLSRETAAKECRVWRHAAARAYPRSEDFKEGGGV